YQCGLALQAASDVLSGFLLELRQSDRMLRGSCHGGLHRRRKDRPGEHRVGSSRVDDFGDAELVVVILAFGACGIRRGVCSRLCASKEAGGKQSSLRPLEQAAPRARLSHGSPLRERNSPLNLVRNFTPTIIDQQMLSPAKSETN